MNTEVINSMVEAATALRSLFDAALAEAADIEYNSNGEIRAKASRLSELCFSDWITRHYTQLGRLNELKNEYSSNVLTAPEPARVKEYYRQQIQRCKELCPYADGENMLEPVIEKLAERCKGKKGYKVIADDDEKQEYLWRAADRQQVFARRTAAIADWWNTIEPSPGLKPLAAYPMANTERARKYFAKAILAGMMMETSTGYKWLLPEGRGNKAALAYFLGRVYKDNYTPDKELEALFGYSRLGQAARNSATPYATEIDKIFDDGQ